jgi:AraC-like DNA-binding protein
MAEASTSMVRSGGPTSGGSWAAWIAAPDARLRPGVVRYSGFVARSDVETVRREVPGAIVPVIIAFDAPYRVSGAEGAATAMRGAAGSRDARGGFDSFLAGMTSRPVLVEAGTVERCIQIDFTPPGMRRLLGVPMELVANRVLGLEELLGPAACELAERLFEAGGADSGGWAARFRLVDELLLARLRATEPVVAEVEWAWRQLVRSEGRVRVTALTSELGWSRKRLGAAFRSEIGLPPKTVARVLRFDHARRRLGAGERAVSVAVAAGYADQAHMVREFGELAGVTPARLEPPSFGGEEQIFNPRVE